MSRPAVQVEHLAKVYRLGEARPGQYRTLRDAIALALRAPFRRTTPSRRPSIRALDDVSFEVQTGEVLGIIGRNGAGKSTLLKILARITEPTSGRCVMWGRLASLLEVGTGFHPELTGRENIFMNAAILGMTKVETHRRFDEIVSFAEVDEFVDTPLKHYSSGMQMRLAFAVAAHLDPEILVIDEVLAVGDAAFQRKCFQRMEAVRAHGRTVLFVSHNMAAVRNFCSSVLWIDQGKARKMGGTTEVTEAYLRDLPGLPRGQATAEVIAQLPSDPVFRLLNVRTLQGDRATNRVMNDAPVQVEIEYEVLEAVSGLRLYLDLCDDNEDILVRSFHDDGVLDIPVMRPGRYRSVAEIPPRVLAPRDFVIVLNVGIYNVRSCLPVGLRIPLQVEAPQPIAGLYPETVVKSKLLIPVTWRSTAVSA